MELLTQIKPFRNLQKRNLKRFLNLGSKIYLDGWFVEGEIKDDMFYVKCIVNEDGKGFRYLRNKRLGWNNGIYDIIFRQER